MNYGIIRLRHIRMLPSHSYASVSFICFCVICPTGYSYGLNVVIEQRKNGLDLLAITYSSNKVIDNTIDTLGYGPSLFNSGLRIIQVIIPLLINLNDINNIKIILNEWLILLSFLFFGVDI